MPRWTGDVDDQPWFVTVLTSHWAVPTVLVLLALALVLAMIVTLVQAMYVALLECSPLTSPSRLLRWQWQRYQVEARCGDAINRDGCACAGRGQRCRARCAGCACDNFTAQPRRRYGLASHGYRWRAPYHRGHHRRVRPGTQSRVAHTACTRAPYPAHSLQKLGLGSHGTVVYSGRLQQRPVAVKRVLREYCHVATREVSLLIKLDDHDNVVRYFAKEVCVHAALWLCSWHDLTSLAHTNPVQEHGDFVYLALEKCSKSLAVAIGKAQHVRDKLLRRAKKTSQPNRRGGKRRGGNDRGKVGDASALRLLEVPIPSNATRRFLRELVVGVAYIHLHSIVHRDIKPHNYLLVPLRAKKAAIVARAADGGAGGETSADAGATTDLTALDETEQRLIRAEYHHLGLKWRPKVSDMGLAKQLRPSASSFGADSHVLHPAARGGSSSSGRAPGSVGWQAPEVMQTLVLQSRGAPAPDSGKGGTTNATGVGAGSGAGAGAGAASVAGNAGGVGQQGRGLEASVESPADAARMDAKRKTRAVDVWSLGCVLYTVLDAGRHPYVQGCGCRCVGGGGRCLVAATCAVSPWFC